MNVLFNNINIIEIYHVFKIVEWVQTLKYLLFLFLPFIIQTNQIILSLFPNLLIRIINHTLKIKINEISKTKKNLESNSTMLSCNSGNFIANFPSELIAPALTSLLSKVRRFRIYRTYFAGGMLWVMICLFIILKIWRCNCANWQSSMYSTKWVNPASFESGTSFITYSILSRQCFLNWNLLSVLRQFAKKLRMLLYFLGARANKPLIE